MNKYWSFNKTTYCSHTRTELMASLTCRQKLKLAVIRMRILGRLDGPVGKCGGRLRRPKPCRGETYQNIKHWIYVLMFELKTLLNWKYPLIFRSWNTDFEIRMPFIVSSCLQRQHIQEISSPTFAGIQTRDLQMRKLLTSFTFRFVSNIGQPSAADAAKKHESKLQILTSFSSPMQSSTTAATAADVDGGQCVSLFGKSGYCRCICYRQQNLRSQARLN